MHNMIMSIKHDFGNFIRSTAGHDALLAGVLCMVLLCSGAVALTMPGLLASDLPASTLCGSDKTVFTTFASDRPC